MPWVPRSLPRRPALLMALANRADREATVCRSSTDVEVKKACVPKHSAWPYVAEAEEFHASLHVAGHEPAVFKAAEH